MYGSGAVWKKKVIRLFKILWACNPIQSNPSSPLLYMCSKRRRGKNLAEEEEEFSHVMKVREIKTEKGKERERETERKRR